jgi:hypothetical protein
MGMYDSIKVKQDLPLPKDIKLLKSNWKDYTFQTKDLDNCLCDYFISEEGFLYEHVVEREYISYTKEERKVKGIKPWDLWKEVIEKETYDKKIEDYHGKIRFYTYDDYNEESDYWVEFDAYFVYGKLDKIELVNFKKEKARFISNKKWKEEYEKHQKHPWNVFKKYASYVGWKWFWRKVSSTFYNLSRGCTSVQYFIIRNFL